MCSAGAMITAVTVQYILESGWNLFSVHPRWKRPLFPWASYQWDRDKALPSAEENTK
jgi:hypothetical protein